MNTPSELRYTKDHEWIRITGDVARVGITDYAQDALGDIVFVQLPETGATVTIGDSFSEIESTKSVNDVYAPVTGTVTSVNESLRDTPELLNSDPYGAGWICEITMTGSPDAGLMSASDYEALIGS